MNNRITWLILVASVVWPTAQRHGVKPEIVMAQIFCESSFRHDVINAGCHGFTQVRKKTWGNIFDFNRMLEPKYNINAGCWILAHYLKISHGDYRRALKLYNSGFKKRDTGYAVRVLLLAGKK
jgi:soluble lytic murein transglycosylase-like protein